MAVEASPEPAAEYAQGRVAKNAIIYFAGQIISWLVALLTVSIIPRTLGEKAYGQYSLASATVVTVGVFFMLGIEHYLIREVGRDRTRAEYLVRAPLGLRIALLPAFIVVTLLALRGVRADAMIWRLGCIGVAAVGVSFLAEPLRSALAGREEARRVSITDVLTS